MPPTETTVDGNSLTSDGTHKINPGRPESSFGKLFKNVAKRHRNDYVESAKMRRALQLDRARIRGYEVSELERLAGNRRADRND